MRDDDKDPPEGEPRPAGEAAGIEGKLPIGRRRFVQVTGTTAAAIAAGCGGGMGPGEDAGGGEDAGRDAGGGTDAGLPDAGGSDAALDDGGIDAGPGPDAGADGGPGDAAADADPGEMPEATPESEMFGIGVASGDVLPDRAIVWTRYYGGAPLVLTVWEMRDDGSYGARIFDDAVTAAPGGFVHVDVTGLTSGRRYRYAFFETMDDTRTARSPIGRFRAAIAADTEETLLVGACSCTYNPFRPQTLEHAGGREDIDFFLLLGDTSYNDGADTVDEYRSEWEESLRRDGYLALRAATSVLATWDDHEVDNNWNPERFDMAQAARARQTFFENLPLRRDATEPDQIWKRIRWGRTLEVFVLDCRGERRPSTREMESVYLSPEQLDWLKAGLIESTAVFKLIANSVPIGDFPDLFGADDRWEGYPAQRTEILRFIDDMGIEGVFWVSGDFHLGSIGWVGRMKGQPGDRQLEVLAGPGAQLPNPLSFLLGRPQFHFATERNNYVTLGLDPATRELTITFHQPDGGVLTTMSYTL